jgi:sarcosine oxidase, subunit gamma
MAALRTSPIFTALEAHSPEWGEHAGMRVALRLRGENAASADTLALADVSSLVRTGLKGPGAVQWLEAQGIAVPQGFNRWVPLPEGGLVARLARTEFLIEDDWAGGPVVRLAAALRTTAAGVYPVPRQDCAIDICGANAPALFAETCAVPFAMDPAEARIVTLTTMVGVGVTVLRQDVQGRPCWRLWCDGTSGPYLWETLTSIAAEHGGGPMGVRVLHGDISQPVAGTQGGRP